MVASRANRTRRRTVASRRVARAPSALSSPSSRSIALSVRRASLRRSSHARVVAVVAIRASRPGAPAFARARSIDRSRNHRVDRPRDDRAIDRSTARSIDAGVVSSSIAPLEALFRQKAIATATIRRGVRASQKRDATATRSARDFGRRCGPSSRARASSRTPDSVDRDERRRRRIIHRSRDRIDRFFAIGDLIRDGDACDAFGRRAGVAGGDADAGSSRERARAARGAVRGARGRRGGGREHETVEDDGGGVHGSRAQETSDAAGREVGGRDRV